MRALLLLLLGFSTALANADVRRDYVDSRVGQLHARMVEPATAGGPPVILLHLVPNSSQVFEQFLPLIADDRSAIAFDLPGFGMSDPVKGDETVPAYADAILDGIDALTLQQVDLIGYHTGAAVAAEMATRRPELVRRVVLVAVPVLTREERDRFAALPPIAFDEEGEFAKAEWQRSLHWRGPGQSVDSVKRTYAEKMRPGARERGAQAVVAYDLGAALGKIGQPLLVIRPQDDLWEATLRAKPLVPDAQWVEMPHYGHGLFEVAAEELAELIDEFLDE